jgi:hypothetical protein
MVARQQSQPVANLWSMLTIVLVRAIDKGQILSLIFGAAVLLLIWRMPSEDAGRCITSIVEGVREYYLLGDILLGASLVVGYFLWKQRIGTMQKEINRISAERDRLQESDAGRRLGSSEGQ